MASSTPSVAPSSARHVAVLHLDRIEAAGAYVGLVESDADLDLDAREERQVREYVAGVTRWRRWLDFLINTYYRGAPEKLEARLRQVLRLGLYELLFLRTPPHAAIHEAVELAKQLVRPQAGGLVNGVLRTIQRQRGQLPEPDTGKPERDLAIRHSHPTWMVRRWLERYGPDATEDLLIWNNTRPIYGLRINTQRITVEAFRERLREAGIPHDPSPDLDDFVRMRHLQPLLHTGLLEEGWCAVQDESAGLVVRLLDPQPGDHVLDLCAAPGGKALYAAIRMHDTGRVQAVDVNPQRLGLVRQAAETHRLQAVEATEAVDARDLADRTPPPQAYRVLLDAPCTGLGVLAKRADLRWNRDVADLKELTALQAELLDAAARLVQPGGLLVYSTCTIEPEENGDQVEAFLARHPAFELESAAPYVPEVMVTPEGYYATLPHRDGIDGAFGARLRRRVE